MAAQLPDMTATTLVPGGSQEPLPSLVSSRRLKWQKTARALRLWVPAGIIILLLFMCFVWPYVYTIPPGDTGSILAAGEPPFSPGHWLGTDPNGVDIFSMLVYGGQVSFEISLAVTAIGVVVGGIIGMMAGYFGGWVDPVLSRIVDVLIAFPALVLVLAVAEVLGPSETHLIYALSFFSVPVFARVFRASTLVARQQPFITAARLSGTSNWKIIFKHILPNVIPGVATFSLLGIGIIVILEGAVDFLGLGIQVPQPSWGAMIAKGQNVLTAEPQYVLIPSIVLLILVMSLNLLGDALRERWGVR
jgi:peptide/nickel transport system permease protein